MSLLPVADELLPELRFFVFMPRERLNLVAQYIGHPVDRIAVLAGQRRVVIQWRMLDPRFLHLRLISAEIPASQVDRVLLILNRPFTHEEKSRPMSRGYNYEAWQTEQFVKDGLAFVTLPSETYPHD